MISGSKMLSWQLVSIHSTAPLNRRVLYGFCDLLILKIGVYTGFFSFVRAATADNLKITSALSRDSIRIIRITCAKILPLQYEEFVATICQKTCLVAESFHSSARNSKLPHSWDKHQAAVPLPAVQNASSEMTIETKRFAGVSLHPVKSYFGEWVLPNFLNKLFILSK